MDVHAMVTRSGNDDQENGTTNPIQSSLVDRSDMPEVFTVVWVKFNKLGIVRVVCFRSEDQYDCVSRIVSSIPLQLNRAVHRNVSYHNY
jgi:hypothetical protein